MTVEVLYDSILSKELHILVHDAMELPIIINHPMITELHQVEEVQVPDMMSLAGMGMGAMGGMGADVSILAANAGENLTPPPSEGSLITADKHAFKVTPSEVQGSDWIWETTKGQLRFSGIVNKEFVPFEMDFWLR